jgi:hypothetical protein
VSLICLIRERLKVVHNGLNNNLTEFSIYLCAELNSRWSITGSYNNDTTTTTTITSTTTNNNDLSLFIKRFGGGMNLENGKYDLT